MYVIVGMDFGVVTESAAENFYSAVGDDFVGIHVEADAGAGLEDVHDEFVVPAALLDILRGLNNCVGDFFIYQTEVAVGFGGGFFHHAEGADQRGMGAHAGDGVVFDGARGLDSVVHVGGDLLGAERIFFFAGGRGHEGSGEPKIIATSKTFHRRDRRERREYGVKPKGNQGFCSAASACSVVNTLRARIENLAKQFLSPRGRTPCLRSKFRTLCPSRRWTRGRICGPTSL